jgi:hypothetical protein
MSINGIGFIGKMRSGKDEAANYIKSKYGGNILKFADPLYEIEAAIFKIVGIPIPEDKTKRRRLLQFIGTEWGRETIDPDLWIKLMDNKIMANRLLTDNFMMVTDVRFPNEVEVLRQHGFAIIQIQRPDDFRIAAGATLGNHASEVSLDAYTDFDIKILNNVDGLDAYHRTVDDVYNAIINDTYNKGVTYVTSHVTSGYI